MGLESTLFHLFVLHLASIGDLFLFLFRFRTFRASTSDHAALFVDLRLKGKTLLNWFLADMLLTSTLTFGRNLVDFRVEAALFVHYVCYFLSFLFSLL